MSFKSVACSKPTPGDGGYATVAATCFSLALGLVAAAVTARAAAEYGAARSDLARTRSQYALAGGQEAAALALSRSNASQPLAWRLEGSPEGMEARAEPEVGKLSLAAAARLDDAVLQRLQVGDGPALRERLRALAAASEVQPSAVEGADSAPLWKVCSRSFISPIGRAKTLPQPSRGAPETGDVWGHAGEVWRLKVSVPGGWSDDRLVRLTGDSAHPAATIERHLVRTGTRSAQCDAILANP